MFLQVMLCKGKLAQLEQVLKNIKVYTTLKKYMKWIKLWSIVWSPL